MICITSWELKYRVLITYSIFWSFSLFIGLKVEKRGFWTKIDQNSQNRIFKLLRPIKIGETSENKNLLNFLYLNYPNLHAYQFVGQLKNFSETRNDFRAKCYHDERFNLLVENSNVPSKCIFYKCLKKILDFFYAWFLLC